MQVQILMLFNSGFIFSELCLYISIFLHYPPSFSTFPHKICVTYWGSARLSSTSPVIMTPIRRELQIDSVYLCYLILCTNYQNISRYKVFISLSSLEMKWVFFNLSSIGPCNENLESGGKKKGPNRACFTLFSANTTDTF